MKSTKKNKKSKFPIVMGIIWSIIIFIAFEITLSIYTYKEPYYKHASGLLEDLETEKYGKFAYDYMNQESSGLTIDKAPEFKYLAAVNHYIEAAGLLKVYEDCGDEERTQFYADKKEKYRKELKSYLRYTEDIDDFIENY